MDTDWRLFREQEKYLYGVSLVYHKYISNNPLNDHDHCEFCMEKFGTYDNELKYGYSTEDNKIWICPQCYKDFKNKFKWKILRK